MDTESKDVIQRELHNLINDALPDAPFTYNLDFLHLAKNTYQLIELLVANYIDQGLDAGEKRT